MTFVAINPTTGKKIREYSEMNLSEVEDIIAGSELAFMSWRSTDFTERSSHLRKVSEELRNNRDKYAVLMTKEMGKPIREARTEVEKCAWVCDYYVENAESFLSPEIVETDASISYIAFQPLGIILAIMPWNFPFWQVFRCAAPAIMAGNTVLLKHAPNVPGCAKAIEQIFSIADYPEYLFKTLLVDITAVEKIIEDPRVKAVTLTGSTRAGSAVAKKAGEFIKKVVLELGGSDPYIVLEDADLEQTMAACVTSKLINSGQSCIAAKRFIVVEPLRNDFEKLLVERMDSAKVGDPMEENTQVGPQARADLRENLHRQVKESVENGARCLLGGLLPEGDGFFYPTTVLTDVKPDMPAYHEELFGPVATIIPVKDEDEAIRVANDTSYGLGGAVFTKDVARGEEIATKELDVGCCFVNDFVRSDPRLPFGGIKQSGFGRELSHYGIKEFVNIKTIFVK